MCGRGAHGPDREGRVALRLVGPNGAGRPTTPKASGDVAPVWFLALQVPGPWQWPTVAFMVLPGSGAFALAWRIYVAEAGRLARA